MAEHEELVCERKALWFDLRGAMPADAVSGAVGIEEWRAVSGDFQGQLRRKIA
jgi:hypothetical protein